MASINDGINEIVIHISLNDGDTVICGCDIYHPPNGERWDRHQWVTESEWGKTHADKIVRCMKCNEKKGKTYISQVYEPDGPDREMTGIKAIHAADMDFGTLLGYVMQRCEDNTRDAFAAFTADSDSARKYMRVFTHLDNAVKAYTGK